MTITYKLNGKPILPSKALLLTIKGFAENGMSHPNMYFTKAQEASQDGYIARDFIEDMYEGLTMRHSHEEQS